MGKVTDIIFKINMLIRLLNNGYYDNISKLAWAVSPQQRALMCFLRDVLYLRVSYVYI